MTQPTGYRPIDPYERGMLAVGDGNRVYWETCGNPSGTAALALHGGPGSGCSASMRRYFDPAVYRIVLFDQRNCGRSTPHASDPAVSLAANTTSHLLADIELLRELLQAAGRLGSVPGTLIQGTLDLTNLVGTPWLLAAAWPGSDLQLIDDAGHGGSARLRAAIVTATDSFAAAKAGRD